MFCGERQELHAITQGGAVADDGFGLQSHAHFREAELHAHGISGVKIGGQNRSQSAFTHIDQASGDDIGNAGTQYGHVHWNRKRVTRHFAGRNPRTQWSSRRRRTQSLSPRLVRYTSASSSAGDETNGWIVKD